MWLITRNAGDKGRQFRNVLANSHVLGSQGLTFDLKALVESRQRLRPKTPPQILHLAATSGPLDIIPVSSLMVHMDRGYDTLWLPKSFRDLRMLPPTSIIYKSLSCGITVVQTAPNVVIKYGAPFSEEIICTRFARRMTSLPVPRIIHHPPFTRIGAWYICMEKIPGVSLDKVIDTLTVEQLSHIASQLKSFLAQLRSVESSKMLGSISGGPYRNEFFPSHLAPKDAFSSAGEFLDYYRWMLMLFCTEKYTESLLSRIPRNAAIKFTHGDLLPKNILVEGSRVTGIIDWATGGFYPAYWEYCRMHDPNFMTPGWKLVLQEVFLGEPREREINAVCELVNAIAFNLA